MSPPRNATMGLLGRDETRYTVHRVRVETGQLWLLWCGRTASVGGWRRTSAAASCRLCEAAIARTQA